MCTNVDVRITEGCRSSYIEDGQVLEHHAYVGRERSLSLQLPIRPNSMKSLSTSPTSLLRSLHDQGGLRGLCPPASRHQRRSGYQLNMPLPSFGDNGLLLQEPLPFLNLSLAGGGHVIGLNSDGGSTLQPVARNQRLHISRDNEQPISGSLSNLHRRCSEGSFIDATTTSEESVDIEEEEEEADSLTALESSSRQRSSTNPETKAFRRRLKAKMMMRPPSPPLPECSSNILRRLSSEAISRSSGSLNGCLSEELLIEDEELDIDCCSVSVVHDLPVIVETV